MTACKKRKEAKERSSTRAQTQLELAWRALEGSTKETHAYAQLSSETVALTAFANGKQELVAHDLERREILRCQAKARLSMSDIDVTSRELFAYSKIDSVEARVSSWQAIESTGFLNGEAIDATHALQRFEPVDWHFAGARRAKE